MERRKTRIFGVCISIMLTLSLILALFGVLTLNKSDISNGTYLDTVQPVLNEGYTENNYLGGVGDQERYINSSGYVESTDWVAISNGTQLQSFLKQEGSYSGKSGYLTANVTLDWGTNSTYAGLAPGSVGKFTKWFDGCGYTVTLEGGGPDIIACDHAQSVGQRPHVTAKDIPGYEMPDNSGNPYPVAYHCFGGMLNELGTGGKLFNFKFYIPWNHKITYRDTGSVNNNEGRLDAHIAFGGLVGYNSGGDIDNVVVELAADKQLYVSSHEGIDRDDTFSKSGCNGAILLGLVVGASRGGTISNATAIFGTNSKLYAEGRSGYWQSAFPVKTYRNSGSTLIGGIAGYVANGAKLNNLYAKFENNSRLHGYIKTHQNGANRGPYKCYRKIGGIIGVNSGASVTTAMVSGNLDCMIAEGSSGGTGDGEYVDQMKNIYIAEGPLPGTMIYMNATGGTNKEGNEGGGSAYNQGYGDCGERAILTTNGRNNGNNGVAIPYFFNHDGQGVVIFVPQGKILWTLYSSPTFSNLESGIIVKTNYPDAATTSEIEVGINSTGEIGFYKMASNGEVADTNGVRWMEMSDQTRMAKNGGVDSPLYYDGTTYELKMKINGQLYDKGLRVINVGDLKNSMNVFNGRAVKLYCDDNGDREHAVAYSDEQEKVVVLLNNVINDSMSRTITIQKRSLLVRTSAGYKRGETTIFGNAYVSFNKMTDDRAGVYSGFAANEQMMWQDTGYNEGVNIKLNIAGRQLLRPSTNNYILYQEVELSNGHMVLEEIGSYFAAVIKPHTVKVHPSIYINGAAVGGEYNFMSNFDFGNADKNAQKRTITITARLDDSHFTASAVKLIDKNGNEITGISWNDNNGLMTATYTATDDSLKEIAFVDYAERFYTVSIDDGVDIVEKTDYKYGDKVYLDAPAAKEGEIFVGWQRKDGSYLTYLPKYSLKVQENFTLTAVYEDIDMAAKPWKHIYRANYNELKRECYYHIPSYDAEYRLPNEMGWIFKGWEEVSKDEVNKVVEFKALFEETADAPKVKVVYDNKNSVFMDYGAPITLEANTTYLVNSARVDVGEQPSVIYAITDLNIEKVENIATFPGIVKEKSMKYESFLLDGIYYISATFVYGKADAEYDTETNKPNLTINGFNASDFTQYVRQGNVYQISMVIPEKEIECRFGNNAEIATFLQVEDYVFDEIMIFKRIN